MSTSIDRDSAMALARRIVEADEVHATVHDTEYVIAGESVDVVPLARLAIAEQAASIARLAVRGGGDGRRVGMESDWEKMARFLHAALMLAHDELLNLKRPPRDDGLRHTCDCLDCTRDTPLARKLMALRNATAESEDA